MSCLGKGRGHRFGRVFHQRVGRVYIEIKFTRHIGGNAAAGEPGDIGQMILQPGKFMQIAQGRGAIMPGAHIQPLHRRTASAEINLIAANLDRAVRVAAMPSKAFCGPCDGIFDHCARKCQPPGPALYSPCPAQVSLKPWRHLTDAKFRQKPQARVIDSAQIDTR
jgi:hypothetical protein